MGIHSYNCPTCYSIQRVKAQAGEVVEIKDCDACANEKAQLALGPHFGEQPTEAFQDALDYATAEARKRREKREAR